MSKIPHVENVHVTECNRTSMIPKYPCAKMFLCQKFLVLKIPRAEMSPCQNVSMLEHPCAEMSAAPNAVCAKMFLWWNIRAEMTLTKTSGAEIVGSLNLMPLWIFFLWLTLLCSNWLLMWHHLHTDASAKRCQPDISGYFQHLFNHYVFSLNKYISQC